MRFIRTRSILISFFSASPAIQKNMLIQNTRLFNSSIIRYGRSAIGARISKGSASQYKRVPVRRIYVHSNDTVHVSRLYRSLVLSRSLFPSTTAAVDGLFLNNYNACISLHHNYKHNVYVTTERMWLLSYIMHSSFTRYQIAPNLVTCFRSNELFKFCLFSRTAIRYHEVPCAHGFFLRATAIRFNARSVLTTLASTFIERFKESTYLPTTTAYLSRVELSLEKKAVRGIDSTRANTVVSDSDSDSDSANNSNSKLSFYEASIIEINKIAVLGKRVFRNATSSRKIKFSLSGSYIDELVDNTRAVAIRTTARRRQYMYRRSRRLLRNMVRLKYGFSRFYKRCNLSSLRPTLFSDTQSAARPSIPSVHRQRLTKQLLIFFYSIVLRDKVSLRIREKYPFDIWVRRHGFYLNSSNIRRVWERFIFYKVTRSLIRNLRSFVLRHSDRFISVKSTRKRNVLSTFNTIKKKKRQYLFNKKYYSQPMRNRLNTDWQTYSFTRYANTFTFHASCSNSNTFTVFNDNMFFNSVISFLSLRVLTSSRLSLFLHLFFLSTRSNNSKSDVKELRIVYQSIDKIDMCIRTIFELSGRNIHNYQELCKEYKHVLSNSFLFHYRPFLSDLYNRTLLRVPSDVGSEVLSHLPIKYLSVLRRISYSNSKLHRYKKYLVRQGILKIPTFSFLDGFFSCYKNVTWKTRAFFRTLKVLRNTTLDFIPHGFSFYQNTTTYVLIFYLFLYSYLFLRKNVQCDTLSTLSRISLFSGYSLHFLNSLTNTVTSTVFLYSFLSRIPSLYKTRSQLRVSSHSNLKRDYLNIRPFFHGDSIVFLKHISHGIKRIPFISNVNVACAKYNGPCYSVFFRNLSQHFHFISLESTFERPRTDNLSTRLLAQSSNITRTVDNSLSGLESALPRVMPMSFVKKARKYFSLSRRRYQKKWYVA